MLAIIEKQKRELELKDEQIKVLTGQLEFLNKKLNQQQEQKSLEISSNNNNNNHNNMVNEQKIDDDVNAEYKNASSLNKVSLNSLLENESEGEDSGREDIEEKEEKINNNEELELEEAMVVQNEPEELEPWVEDLELEEAVVVTSSNNNQQQCIFQSFLSFFKKVLSNLIVLPVGDCFILIKAIVHFIVNQKTEGAGIQKSINFQKITTVQKKLCNRQSTVPQIEIKNCPINKIQQQNTELYNLFYTS